MNTSELVHPRHLNRRAVIYVRQSTPNQVLTNKESQRMQYALRERAAALGWQEMDIQVIDTDLGRRRGEPLHRWRLEADRTEPPRCLLLTPGMFDAVGKHDPSNCETQQQCCVIVGFHVVTSPIGTSTRYRTIPCRS